MAVDPRPPVPGSVGADGALPHDVEAEISLLGSLLRNNAAINDVLQILDKDDFYRDQHRVLYEVIVDLFNERKPVDVTILNSELDRRAVAAKAGGPEYLITLCETVPVPGNAEHYARIVKDRASRRRLIQTCQGIVQQVLKGGARTDDLLDEAEKNIFACVNRKAAGSSTHIYELLKEVYRTIEDIHDRKARLTGLSTGFFELDDMILGLQPSQFIVVAGRPSMGKTSFALNIAEHVGLVERRPVLFFSMEMSRQTVAQNILCSHTRVSAYRLRKGQISEEDRERLALAAGTFEDAPIFIDDSSNLSVLDLRARARRMKAEHDIALVVVDYLQLMEMRETRPDSRQQEVAMISRSLKALAREIDVPVIALSQLSRAVESRDDHRPRLADLRECVTGDTPAVLADGRRAPIRDLVGTTPEVRSVAPDGRVVTARAECVWSVGRRPLCRVGLASGRTIRATPRHRLLGERGWVRVRDIACGDRIALTEEARILRRETLPKSGGDDLFWDRVVSVRPAGEEEVFDLTVPGPASWLADGIVSHNSGAIEQDADCVMMLYRDEYYNRNSEEKGVCEVSIAKQRNGPVGNVKLTFMSDFMRFANFAPRSDAEPPPG